MVDLVLDRWQRTPANTGPGSAGDPAGIPRVRPRSGQPDGRDVSSWRELALVASVAMVLGFAQGARVAVGAAEAPTPAHTPIALEAPKAEASAGTEPGRTAIGRFWRPVGSTATRPSARLTPRRWSPGVPSGLPVGQAH